MIILPPVIFMFVPVMTMTMAGGLTCFQGDQVIGFSQIMMMMMIMT